MAVMRERKIHFLPDIPARFVKMKLTFAIRKGLRN